MSEQGDADALRPSGARRRSWKGSRRLWALLGALCCLLGAVALATARVNPFDPRLYDPFGGPGVPFFDDFHGYNEPVSVCARHSTPGPYADSSGGTCSRNDVVLSMSDASRAWVTFPPMGVDLVGDHVPATVYLRQHDGHWRSVGTCRGIQSCAIPLRWIFQAVGLTLRAGMTYDIGVYVDEDVAVCGVCTPPPAEPALPLSFTTTR
jgi:hypothetical protein